MRLRDMLSKKIRWYNCTSIVVIIMYIYMCKCKPTENTNTVREKGGILNNTGRVLRKHQQPKFQPCSLGLS